DAGSSREPRDQSAHTLGVRRRSRIVPRRDRHDRVPRGSTKRVPRCRIAEANRSGERDARGGVGERELVRIAPHGPPDPCPASDAVGALSGQLGVRPSGSPHRDERDARRAGEIATLRSLGASPAAVAGVYEAQAVVLALAGAILGSALGIVAAHAVVSFAPILGLPNLVILSPPTAAVLLALLISGVAAVL